MASYITVRSMVWALCYIKIKEFMKDNGQMIKRKVTVLKNFQTNASIKVSMKMVSPMESAAILGQMDNTMMDNG